MQVMDEATELPHTKRDKDYTSFLYLAFVTKLLWVLVSFSFSVLPLKKEPCPSTAPLSTVFVSELLKEHDSLQGWLHRSLLWDPAPTPLPPRNPIAG